jgi:predicted DCC family thiol-disulfide oxidoreductase YuxK
MITVFYDGKCGLCRREIAYYKRIASQQTFEWIDITVTPEPFTALGYSRPEGLKALHVRDNAGNMQVGVDAFATIWQQLPRLWILAQLVRAPILRSIARRLYRAFAAWRFKKLGYGTCEL